MKFESAYDSALNLNGKEFGKYTLRLTKLAEGIAYFNMLDTQSKNSGELMVRDTGWAVKCGPLDLKIDRPTTDQLLAMAKLVSA